MRLLHTVAAFAAASLVTAGSAEAPLRVIRTTPTGDADPLATITVTFDRPVAGSLDRTVDPHTVMRVEPAIEGRLEWRDPVTVRLVPTAPLRADARYTVTVDTSFVAMDGTRLEEPARFEFRVRGPTLLGGSPVGTGEMAEQLLPNQRFDVVYSASVDPSRLAAAAHIEASPVCQGPRITRLRVVGQRPVATNDDWRLREAGGWERNRAADTLRRIVQLAPVTPLAHGCNAMLVVPNELAADMPKGLARWPFRTYGDFRLTAARCGSDGFCPTGPVEAVFSTPVKGSVVQRSVTLLPGVPFVVRDTAATSTSWTLEAPLDPNKAYVVVVDTSARDAFGQRLQGNPAILVRSTGYEPSLGYPFGRQLVERKGFRTLAVQHVNVDTMVASIAPIPDSLEARFLARYAWSVGELWDDVEPLAQRRRIATASTPDRPAITGVALPVSDATRRGAPTLYAVKIEPARRAPPNATRRTESGESPVSVVQVTDLGVTARIGTEEGMVWVTGVSDGLPRGGARVTLHAPTGQVIATGQTNAQGIVRLGGFRATSAESSAERGFEGYVAAALGDDRALVAVNQYDPDLSPWNFGVRAAWGDDRYAIAGAVFTERGIYRPGERVYAKAIVRTGSLGALSTPAAGDSARWVFTDRDGQPISERTVALSAFGTNDQALDIPATAAIGQHQVRLLMRRAGAWRQVAWTAYRVAEYRPPEFLVELTPATAPAHPGDRFAVTVRANYLFGAPMGRAEVRWSARQAPLGPWDLEIPGTDGWHLGESGWGWDEDGESADPVVFANGTDTLDARGERTIGATIPSARTARAARVTIDVSVSDVNRQSVGSTYSTVVHPAAFYVVARPQGESWFWKEGEAQRIAVRAIRPDGGSEAGVRVRGVLVRREWHQVRRIREGMSQLVGEWVSDTVSRCSVTTTAATPPTCTLTPRAGGMHMVLFDATDARGRRSATSFGRWIAGSGYVPWSDETQFKMDVIADRDRYSVGDTATVMLASPFPDAEAWITVEREGILEHRRMRLSSGATTIKLPITEAYVPNAFVSVVVTRGRTEAPGKLDDPGRPTIRVGYAELRVTPEIKRLSVDVAPLAAEYRPGDTARVRLAVRDARGTGARSEVMLWAVDEGVLSLTGYTTPDPIDLLYRARGLGMRLASNLVVVAPQVPDGDKGARRSAGGGGGAEAADVLRSQFRTTAFFLGSIITDGQGNATASAVLPENLTTFRLMAVAVTAADRYGSGESKVLVTRPLVARPSLPRFVRPGDELLAGAVINRRDGTAAAVRVSTVVEGLRLSGDAQRNATLAAGRGAEVRFRFRAQPGDSASFRFDVRGGNDVDAVRMRVPVRPDYSPRFHTVSGMVRDTATAEFRLPGDIDPARSRLSLSLGSSPLAIVRGIRQDLRVYPYYCTEQVISTASPILALLRAERAVPGAAPTSLERGRGEIERAITIIARRQRVDGGIGYWGADDWTTPWLSAYAGHLLLDAREVGITVDQAMLDRLAEYLRATLRGELQVNATRVAAWYTTREARLADQVASVDFLSRIGKPDIGAENELVRMAAQIAREDRIRLAETLHRRGARAPARQLIESVWADVRVEGRRAVLAPIRQHLYFPSHVREAARLLMATLAIEPSHALIGPLVETLATQGRANRDWIWNTQDYAFAVNALAAFERHQREAGTRTVRVRSGNRVLWTMRPGAANIDTAVVLDGLLGRVSGDERTLRLALDAQGTGDAASYFYLTVSEVPLRPPVRPDDAGIRVERWYESFETSQPLTSVTEGELVRVRLRVTVPAERHFVVLDDPLPAGLEAIDLSLRTASALPGITSSSGRESRDRDAGDERDAWGYGRWDSGWWSPWEHREMRDDRVVYSAALLWPGSYTATYIARATTPGVFIRPPAHAEEMYNPSVQGRSDGGTFTVRERPPR